MAELTEIRGGKLEPQDLTYSVMLKDGTPIIIKAFSVLVDDVQEIIMFARKDGVISLIVNVSELVYAVVEDEKEDVVE